jgi:transcriptional regulator with XRE-family HTH domain
VRATAEAIEARRLKQGLSVQAIADVLGITRQAYRRFRDTPICRLRLVNCAAVARFLPAEPEEVLRSEGYWESLSAVGKLLAPQMLRANLSQRSLANAIGLSTNSIENLLSGDSLPSLTTTNSLAVLLNIEPAVLLQSVRQAKKAKGPRSDARNIKWVRRTVRYEGVDGLRAEASDRYESGLGRFHAEVGSEQRAAIVDRRAATLRRRHATFTGEERQRRLILQNLRVDVQGTFGICRVCRRLTYAPPSYGRPIEYHGVCMAKWRDTDPEWNAWFKAVQRGGKTGRMPRGPVPRPYVGRIRQSNAEELAECVATGILFLRMKLRAPRRFQQAGERATVGNLAKELDRTRAAIYARLQRLLKVLPDPDVCSPIFARKVKALAAVSAYLRQDTASTSK